MHSIVYKYACKCVQYSLLHYSNTIETLLLSFTSMATTHFLIVCAVAIVVAVVNFGYVNGATCSCYCCGGSSCNTTLAGTITQSSCSTCNSTLCISNFTSSCFSSNATVTTTCTSGSPHSYVIEPMQHITTLVMAFFSMQLYWMTTS